MSLKGNYSSGHDLGEGIEHPAYVAGAGTDGAVNVEVKEQPVHITGYESNSNAVAVVIKDEPIRIAGYEENNAVGVYIQDQTSRTYNIKLMGNRTSISLATNSVYNTRTIQLNNSAGISVGKLIGLKENDRHFQAEVTNVSSNTISPLDYSFTTAATALFAIENMAVNGAVTPVIFNVTPAGLNNGIAWDITQLKFRIIDDSAMDDSKFGSLTKLTNGVVIRTRGIESQHIFNIKTNGELIQFCQSYAYHERAGGSGKYGLEASKIFAGQQNSGVTIRLHAEHSDSLDIIIQDDLTDLISFGIVAIGHLVVS